MTPKDEKRARDCDRAWAASDYEGATLPVMDRRDLLAALDEARRERDALNEALRNESNALVGALDDLQVARSERDGARELAATFVARCAAAVTECSEARRERDAMERQRDESRDLYEKMMVAIHERAGCRRDGAAGILGWIDDAQMALTFHAKAQRMLFSGTRNVAARLRALLETGS